MSFASPIFLLALLLIPLAVLATWAARRRGRRYAVRHPGTALLAVAASAGSPWRRWLPGALALLAVGLLAVALAKPQHQVRVPVEQASVVLVTDHSGSMQATDVDPDRLTAAQRAAGRFISKLPSSVKVGVVGFGEATDVVQSPTTDHDAARQAIDAQQANGGTATGDALDRALRLVRNGRERPPAAIVLLSDGARTAGRDPIPVARRAKQLGVPISTVALGSPDATIPNPADPFGTPLSVAPDAEALRQIAADSGGTAYKAADRDRLDAIYEGLGSRLGTKPETREITPLFAVAGLLALLGAAGLGIARGGRLV